MAITRLTLAPLLLIAAVILSTETSAQPAAPAPGPAGPINLTAILEKGGQFTTFMHLLKITQVGEQVNIQVNSSSEGMTVFAPTDNAFQNLKAGTLNKLTADEQVKLILYHVSPKFYTLDDLLSVSNPVRTQASGRDNGVYGLNFTGEANQVNVSTGYVETRVSNALRSQRPSRYMLWTWFCCLVRCSESTSFPRSLLPRNLRPLGFPMMTPSLTQLKGCSAGR
ncbi:hypothetical protein Bca52824_061963 [Brassica carinata]|uniref:FAS1 domain-containing protein n=1 Tax=Brassica carinata TaxID=52824 RepID=A0A8X7QG01_BRACI|nr:hypothetical protein Bca52824_061963 [Brassica carinata]